ncbi:unnamed protein product [Mycena citricolor]|uniref:Uncharacterized protein n=1 Tax=Mycena citricolor TaxID=2018698 RepID=A0AAD2GUI7_9AGAR|nr:unnamed protein product [Mycena citricolor]
MSSADALGAEQALLLQLLKDSTLTNELAVAALSIVVVEHIATLRDEVGGVLNSSRSRSLSSLPQIDLVWRTRISLANVFYIWVRQFLSLTVTSLTDSSKIRYFTLGVICFSVYSLIINMHIDCRVGGLHPGAASVDSVPPVQDTAVLSRSPLDGAFPPNELHLAAADKEIKIRLVTVYVHAPGLTGCYSQGKYVPRLLTYYAVPPFLMATTMFAMTLHRCRLSLVTSRAFGRGPIIAMFLRDGVFWFLGVVLLATAEIVIWHTARPTLAQLPILQVHLPRFRKLTSS